MEEPLRLRGVKKFIFLDENPDYEERMGFVLKSEVEIESITTPSIKKPNFLLLTIKSFFFFQICFFVLFTTAGEGKDGGSRYISTEEWEIGLPVIFIMSVIFTFIYIQSIKKNKNKIMPKKEFVCLRCDKKFHEVDFVNCPNCNGEVVDMRFVRWGKKLVKKEQGDSSSRIK